ncbi:MAG: 3-hydroxyacyl-CoA dehydrogenase family protein, partial [Terriglobales bacterium]
MQRRFQRVVVLGAGTMGARLAAHCANVGLEVDLLDQTADLAAAGLQSAERSRPAAFFLPELTKQVRTGSFAEGLEAVAGADWVVEAIVEDLRAKQALLAQIAPWVGAHTVLSTNTSGLRVTDVGAALPHDLRGRWLGTHFFNPPRYMHLVEIIPTTATDAHASAWLAAELERRLGKGIVTARDTPNFIANRIGLFALMNTLRLMQELRLSVEEVDALTGPLLGWPKSATFRTLDLIGLDTLARVVANTHTQLAQDECREWFHLPEWIKTLVERGWLGDKSGKGIYQRRGEEIWAIDPTTLEYHLRQKVQLPHRTIQETARHNPFLQRALEDLFAYCERRQGEISDDPRDMDRAMRWGYNWQYGPFELRAIAAGGAAPTRSIGKTALGNPGCALADLGNGVGGIEFRSKLNVIGADTVALVREVLEGAAEFEAFVVCNGGENFSAGADLMYLLALI